MQTFGILPSQQNLGCGTGLHRQHRTNRNGIAQTGRALHSGNAHAHIALTAVNLRGFAGTIQQRLQNRRGCGQQTILAGSCGQFRKTRSKNETTMLITQHKTVTFQRNRQSMRGRSGQARRGNQLPERCRTGFERVKDFDGLVKHTHTGMNLVALRRHRAVVFSLKLSLIRLRFRHGGACIRRSHKRDYAISHIEMQNVRNVGLW